jgi:CRISPR-associated endonuclease/helicase Cas3
MQHQENIGFWGKIHTDEQGKPLEWLSLTQHCLDVASVFAALLELSGIKRKLDASAGLTLDENQCQRLAVIAFLHDVGKANLGFQDKVFDPEAPRAGHVRELAPLFFERSLCDAFADALQIDTLVDWFDTPEAMESFLLASWSHHGSPVKFIEGDKTGHYHPAKTQWWLGKPGRNPMQAIAGLMQAARLAFPAAFEQQAKPIPVSPALQHRFAGLVMLADWLGSHQSFFPLGRENDVEFPLAAARRAVAAVGLDASLSQTAIAKQPGDFQAWFGFKPRPLQAHIHGLPKKEPKSRLIIAEAETGSGKTEAALVRFFKLFAAGEVDSLYFALPTRVAARELYRRIFSYLEKVFPNADERPVCLLAVPRYARVDNEPVESILPKDQVRWHDEQDQHKQERQWAAEHPKRFLAATIAVGTIDQALLSALQTKHAHLRSVCLDRSLLVVDEVHASDPYMRYLLRGLLAHHVKRMQGHAVLLSATLGAVARAEFLSAAGCESALNTDYASACSAPYPAYTVLDGAPKLIERTQECKTKRVQFDPRPLLKQPDALLPELAEALHKGARVLIVLNTVARAVALQQAMENSVNISPEWLFKCGAVICPHHGRFAASDRELLDQAVSDRWGKDTPAGPVVLVGTQTLEQSLDIDADWLITDLCPMDVLLQRIGRLHRHDRIRPEGFELACCTVLIPDTASLEDWLDANGKAIGESAKAGLGSVYSDMRGLELTWRELAATPMVEIPQDNRRLVEAATHPERLEGLTGERWEKHGQKLSGKILAEEMTAYYASACYDQAFGEFSYHELNENARTRLGLNTLRIPINKPVTGPFGQEITEITIPAHLAPKDKSEEFAKILRHDHEQIVLRYGELVYKYSRYGLEKNDEPTD